MTYRGTSYQKHTKDQSLIISPLNKPNREGYKHSVAIFNIKDVTSSTTLLTQEEALQLRDCMLKSYPLNLYPLTKGQ